MANRNSAGFGLIPTRVLGQGPSTAGFGQYNIQRRSCLQRCWIYIRCTRISNRCNVRCFARYILQCGYNFEADLAELLCRCYSGRCASDDQVASTVAGAHEVIFQTFGFNTTAGSTATGKSSATLDIGSTHATNDTWKFLGLAEDPENEDLTAAYCSVNVVQNLNEIIDST